MSDIELLETAARTFPAATRPPGPARPVSKAPISTAPIISAVRSRLAALTARPGPAREAVALDADDALRPARGLVLGLLIVTPFWVAIGSTLWALLG